MFVSGQKNISHKNTKISILDGLWTRRWSNLITLSHRCTSGSKGHFRGQKNISHENTKISILDGLCTRWWSNLIILSHRCTSGVKKHYFSRGQKNIFSDIPFLEFSSDLENFRKFEFRENWGQRKHFFKGVKKTFS